MKLSIKFIVILIPILTVVGNPSFAQKRKKNKKKQEKVEKLTIATQQDSIEAERVFIEGMRYAVTEEYVKALAWFERALKLNPNSAGIHFKIAEAYAYLNETDNALDFALKALAVNNKNEAYYLLPATLYERKEELEKAKKLYSELIKNVPNSETAYLSIASIAFRQKEYDESLEALDKFSEIFGADEEIVLQKQQIYLKSDRTDEAVAEGRKLIELFPEEPRHAAALADIFLANDRTDEAEEVVNALITNHPDYIYARFLLADIFDAKNESEKALEQRMIAFENPNLDIDGKLAVISTLGNPTTDADVRKRVTEMAKALIKMHSDSYKAFTFYGDLLYTEGDKKLAGEAYVKAAKLEPGIFELWQRVLLIDSELNDTKGMIKHADEALELFPNNGIVWYFKGIGHQLSNDPKKAISALEESKKLTPGNNIPGLSEINGRLGDMYHSLNEFDKSDDAYEKALKLNPKNVYVLNNYSYFLSLRNKNLEKAKSMSEKLIELSPDNPTYLDTHAWVLYKLKNYKAAKKSLEKAIASGTASGTIYEHFGDVLFMLGEKDSAFEQWKRARETGGAGEFLDKKIADKKLYE